MKKRGRVYFVGTYSPILQIENNRTQTNTEFGIAKDENMQEIYRENIQRIMEEGLISDSVVRKGFFGQEIFKLRDEAGEEVSNVKNWKHMHPFQVNGKKPRQDGWFQEMQEVSVAGKSLLEMGNERVARP